MKIGEFARKYQVSRDTVRYYMKMGLLVPNGRDAQYQFDENDCRDMEKILRMKEQRFTLQEIHKYLDIRRTSTMMEPESIQDVLDLMDTKRMELEEEIKVLQGICSSIEKEAQELNFGGEPGMQTGVPLRALSLLVCPCCKSSLELENAALSSRYVYSGHLRCRCGYGARIENGILKTGKLYTAPYDKPDLKRGLYRNVSENFVSYMKKCTNYVVNELRAVDMRGRVLLEGHINGYFFLYNNLQFLEKDCLYIVTDKYPEMLEMYKRNIDRLNLGMDILYLADASMDWPLRKACVDVMINYFGDNEHSFYFKDSYIQDVKQFLKPAAVVLGAELGYHSFARSLAELGKKYPEGGLLGFLWDRAAQIYKEAGYRLERQEAGVITQSYKQYAFECHMDGELLMVGMFKALPDV